MEVLKRPEIWAVLAAFFVLFGLFIGSYSHFPNIENTSKILIVSLLGISSYLIGVRLHRGIKYLGFVPIVVSFILCSLFVGNFLHINIIFSSVLSILPLIGYLWLMKQEKVNPQKIYLIMFVAGLAIFVINMIFNGVPLINPDLHFRMFDVIFPLMIPAFYLMIYPAVKTGKRKNLFFLILIFSMILSTFRLYIFISLFSYLLISLKESDRIDSMKVCVILGLIVFSTVIVGGHIYGAENGYGYIESAIRRPAFTLSVFDRITQASFPWGSDISCFLTDCGKKICVDLFSYEGRLTSTAFGYVLHSFGIPGVMVLFAFFGALLANLRREDYSIYCILLSYFIATIERGLTAGEVVVFTYLGYSVIWWRSRYLWKRLRKAA